MKFSNWEENTAATLLVPDGGSKFPRQLIEIYQIPRRQSLDYHTLFIHLKSQKISTYLLLHNAHGEAIILLST